MNRTLPAVKKTLKASLHPKQAQPQLAPEERKKSERIKRRQAGRGTSSGGGAALAAKEGGKELAEKSHKPVVGGEGNWTEKDPETFP